ncbi:phosphate ABC transporter permease PstA [Corynebacterium mendelii]|uniref:Phosphate transport system permease protein PstA n=1 Tax=Corynebacterium mendelii TaxID=2765362 RepID=A0A939IYU1_9CORY|nr:phosphate ABC transporter permease PstA [Corynebacterium mendelii]MBN9645022.1 phosphate ABC transporter permease PstA [Corynebacterium mendelii]
MTTATVTAKAAARNLGNTTFTPPSGRRKVSNYIAYGLVYAAIAIALIPLGWVLFELVHRGIGQVISAEWWGKSQLGVTSDMAAGGAVHAMIGTFVQVTICAVLSIPIGVFTAIYLVEYGNNGRLAQVTTFMVDILSGVPSIVAALFVYSMWIVLFGFERSGMAVALALVLLMIPVVVRTTEEMLRIVPQDLREAAYALGVPKWKTIIKIVLPTAWSGIVTGIMIAIARVMGESAPVLILVGSSASINWSPLSGNQSSLPLMMLDMYRADFQGPAVDKMWGAALTLVLLIAILTIGARILSVRVTGKQK